MNNNNKMSNNPEADYLEDYHTNEETRKLDKICAGLDMSKIGEIMNNLEMGKVTREEAEEMLKKYGISMGISISLEISRRSSPDKKKNKSGKLEQKADNFSLGYNDFLTSILARDGLDHGYDVFVDGTYLGHRIFTKDSMRKNPWIKRVFNINLWGQRYSVDTVAKFDEEPWFNATEGCISDKVARISIIDEKYEKQLRNILAKIEVYSRKRGNGISHSDRYPIILSYS